MGRVFSWKTKTTVDALDNLKTGPKYPGWHDTLRLITDDDEQVGGGGLQ